MEEIFHGLVAKDFEVRFSTEAQCLEFLAEYKWKDGYTCKRCKNDNFCKGKAPFSRRCTRCKHDESVTANTIFHRCKVPLHYAFKFAWLICNNHNISSYELSRQLEIRHMTCYKFKKKIIECIKNGQNLTKEQKEQLIQQVNENDKVLINP